MRDPRRQSTSVAPPGRLGRRGHSGRRGRRVLLVLVVALSGLALSGGALAASAGGTLNDYTAVLSVSQDHGGSTSSPAPMGLTEQIAVRPVNGPNAAPLTGLTVALGKVEARPAGFPTCSARQIDAFDGDGVCPSGALVASGIFTGALWSPSEPAQAGTRCYGDLDIWNAGHGKLTTFLAFPAGAWCDDLQSGAVPAWTGSLTQDDSTLRISLPLVPGASTDVGNTGLYASISTLKLTFTRLTRRVGHRSVGFLASTGCVKHARSARLGITAAAGALRQRSSLVQRPSC